MNQTGGTLHLDEQLKGYARVNALPWEGVGTAVPPTITATNISKVRQAVGLDWEPAIEPQYRRVYVAGSGDDTIYDYVEPTVTTRSGTKRQQFKYITHGPGGHILDSANGTYNLFSNGEVFDVAESIGIAGIEMGREIRFVAGGEIEGGRKVFLLADLGVREIKGDPSPHVRFMGLVNGHDGTASLKVIGTDIRWTCTNMIHAADLDAKERGTAFSFRHTSRIADRVGRSMQAITRTMLQLDAVDRHTADLLAITIKPADARHYASEFALARVKSKGTPGSEDRAEASHQRATALEKLSGGIMAILGSPTCDGIRDTGYGLYAATVEMLDHRRAKQSKDAVLNRTMINIEPQKALARRVLWSVI